MVMASHNPLFAKALDLINSLVHQTLGLFPLFTEKPVPSLHV